MAATILSARGLSVDYVRPKHSTHAVRAFDLDIAEGEVVGLVGESGTGKSSAALALMNLVRAPGVITGGSVQFGDHDLITLDERRLQTIRGNDISLILQNPRSALNPMLRVGVQIADVIRAHGTKDPKVARARALEMLRLVGINDAERRMDAYPHELSGGMAQRVLIATALSCTPKLLIADEPTSGLDVTIQAQILDDLARGVSETGSAALIVTQDLGVVANYCDRIVVMYAGQVVEQAPVQDFFDQQAHPASRALVSASLKAVGDRLMPDREGTEDVAGCLLHPRCPWNDGDVCEKQPQTLLNVGTDRIARCHRWEQVIDSPRVEVAVGGGTVDE
jgi:ABC-type dipeptide/oligopeptide/nickel transport system ATPase component